MLNMVLVWDSESNSYSLRGFNFSNNEAVIVNKDTNGRIWKIDLGSSPFFKAKGNIPWINYYGIDLKETKNLKKDLYIQRCRMGQKRLFGWIKYYKLAI